MTIGREAKSARGAASTHMWNSEGLPEIHLRVPPTVYPPKEDSELLDEVLRLLGPGKGRRLLEIGCGSGAISISAAMRGWMVEACDINPLAVAATVGNAENCACSDRLKVREGGPFSGNDEGWIPQRPVDLICWNLPYLEIESDAERLGPLEEAGLLDARSRDEAMSCTDSLIQSLLKAPQILNPAGIILLVHSDNSTGGNVPSSWLRAGWASRVVRRRQLGGEQLMVTAVWRPFEGVEPEHMDVVTSTNDLIVESSCPVGTLLTAKSQTKGRGQHGRVWKSLDGAFIGSWSIGIESIKHGSERLQIGAALAVADAVSAILHEPLPSQCWKWAQRLVNKGVFIKWPNDLWISNDGGNRKMAGILAESRGKGDSTTIALGIGLNLQSSEQDAFPASSLSEVTDECLDRLEFSRILHASIASRFDEPSILDSFSDDGVSISAWELMRPLLNTAVELERGDLSTPVEIVGLTDSAALLVRDNDGVVRSIASNESLRWLGLHSTGS
jgi:biotin-(acetyl-CoA carboxylase) ligase/methylase of polypeptide subunit release factors